MTDTKKTLAVACGGTGGHFYPGLTIARKFIELGGNAVLFIGGHNIEEHVELARSFGVDAVPVPAVRLPRSPLQLPIFPFQMISCIIRNARELKKNKVDLALGMGSWASVPMGFAATRLKIPLALHEGNAVPGQANRFLSRRAKLLGLSLPLRDPLKTTAQQISVGMPVRQEIIDAANETVDADKRAAICTDLGFNPEHPICLVFGGSQGARAINQAVDAVVPALAGTGDTWQVIHLTGQDDNNERKASARDAGIQAVIEKRDTGIHRLFQVADAIICRAGASTILELAIMGKYPLLIPLPTAKDDHQTANAQCVAAVNGGVLLPESDLTSGRILDYLKTAPSRNHGDNPGIDALAFPHAAEAMARQLQQLT